MQDDLFSAAGADSGATAADAADPVAAPDPIGAPQPIGAGPRRERVRDRDDFDEVL